MIKDEGMSFQECLNLVESTLRTTDFETIKEVIDIQIRTQMRIENDLRQMAKSDRYRKDAEMMAFEHRKLLNATVSRFVTVLIDEVRNDI